MRLLLILALLTATGALAASPSGTPTTGVRGDWETPSHSIVRIAPCNTGEHTDTQPEAQTLCLAVVKLPPNSPETTDGENPDASLRSRRICGLPIGTGFHQDDPSHLTGGHLYDPKTGHTYKGTITAAGDSLDLHGYIGISIFGRTETWHRVPTLTDVCH